MNVVLINSKLPAGYQLPLTLMLLDHTQSLPGKIGMICEKGFSRIVTRDDLPSVLF